MALPIPVASAIGDIVTDTNPCSSTSAALLVILQLVVGGRHAPGFHTESGANSDLRISNLTQVDPPPGGAITGHQPQTDHGW